MQFLKTVLWVLVAVLAALFARANWNPVTLNLWGDIQADIKIPVLMLITFLIGFLPTWLIMRTRMWTMRRRLEALDRQRVSTAPAGAPVEEESEGLGI
jgi:putative membrane protein